MKCPICEAPLRPGTDRCPSCGYRCPQTHTAPTEQPSEPRSAYTPPNKSKKSTGCCCCLAILLPVLIFAIGAIFSFAEFVMEDFAFAVPEPGYYEDDPYAQEPFEDLIPESVPTPAADDCFLLVDQTLYFLPENWDGSPILNVPETVAGEKVTAIGPDCFRDCTDLTTILLPETVTTIDANAFSGCSKLRGLYIPDGVESIGQDAFAGCIDMEAIYIPASVQSIAEHAFDDCASLLYIFYGGTFEEWDALCDDYINPFTTAVCLDGHYYHGSVD